MDRDSFIITVYCLVVETYKTVKEKYKIRRGGFPPALTDEEVITIEICGAYFKLHQVSASAKPQASAVSRTAPSRSPAR